MYVSVSPTDVYARHSSSSVWLPTGLPLELSIERWKSDLSSGRPTGPTWISEPSQKLNARLTRSWKRLHFWMNKAFFRRGNSDHYCRYLPCHVWLVEHGSIFTLHSILYTLHQNECPWMKLRNFRFMANWFELLPLYQVCIWFHGCSCRKRIHHAFLQGSGHPWWSSNKC